MVKNCNLAEVCALEVRRGEDLAFGGTQGLERSEKLLRKASPIVYLASASTTYKSNKNNHFHKNRRNALKL